MNRALVKCSIPACGKNAHARGMCYRHYQLAKRHGALPEKIPKKTVSERLMEKAEFAKTPHPALSTPCLLWSGKPGCKFGYGVISVDGVLQSAHRASWSVKYGRIPIGMCILHKCDNPRCINPDHLFVGTRIDNNADAVAKGRNRGAHGERNAKAKLNEPSLISIRRMHESGISYARIAKSIGMHKESVRAADRRVTWKHIEDARHE